MGLSLADVTISTPTGTEEAGARFISVRVLAHPNPERVGDFAPLFDAATERSGGRAVVNRIEPEFRTPTGQRSGALGSLRITRTPLVIERSLSGIRLSFAGSKGGVEINGRPLIGERSISEEEIDAGVVVLLGRDLALWIGWFELIEPSPVVAGLLGESSVMRKLRQQIHRVADLDVPVLLRGATGVGKELVAAAIHRYSSRSAGSYVAVNVAGVPPSMAASELFGHKRGAFTGAFEDRKGYFAQAHGGTLFLDEIGDVAFDVQALLLRAVQEGVIQPLGGNTRQVDVRLVAATDSDLESAVARREFREPLLRRFSYEIHVPQLRARREDVGLLFYHFLRERLTAAGEGYRLSCGDDGEPFVPASYVAQMALYHWPGNVRELANVALKFAVENRGLVRARIGDDLRDLIRSRPPTADDPAPSAAPISRPAITATRERRGEPSDADVLAALQHEGFRRERAARRLGVSKSYLYQRLDRTALVPSAAALPAEEIQAALLAASGDIASAAERLRVSRRALRLQMKRLDLSPP